VLGVTAKSLSVAIVIEGMCIAPSNVHKTPEPNRNAELGTNTNPVVKVALPMRIVNDATAFANVKK